MSAGKRYRVDEPLFHLIEHLTRRSRDRERHCRGQEPSPSAEVVDVDGLKPFPAFPPRPPKPGTKGATRRASLNSLPDRGGVTTGGQRQLYVSRANASRTVTSSFFFMAPICG